MIFICSQLESWRVFNGFCGNYGFFLSWEQPFQDCGEGYGLRLKSRALFMRALPSEVYPAGKLQ